MKNDKREIIRLLKDQNCMHCRFSYSEEKITVKIPYEHDQLTGHRKNITFTIWYCHLYGATRNRRLLDDPTNYCEKYEKSFVSDLS